ncbi:MAG TPA: FAD-binding oxidoreductase, partial [Gammaproteobacteria bacterium]|nr:FAD-binding oxidoreductase [Gammaproteobacteria bacterium]
MPDIATHPDSYYAASARTYPEYPSLNGEREADVCVIGGGFSGVSAALSLAERGYRVALMEAGRLGFGASGRNGGQIGSGLRTGIREIERLAGRDNARLLWDMCEEAKAIIAECIERFDIDCDFKPGNLLAATRERFLPGLAAEAEHLSKHYGYTGYQMLSRQQIRELVATEAYCGGRMDNGGGHMHPLNYLLGIGAAARSRGVEIFEKSEVLDIRWSDPCVVRSANGQ